jgi:hypothetical protein
VVARKSYGLDILFKVVDVKNNGIEDIIILKGIECRIQADAPESDLLLQDYQRIRGYSMKSGRTVEKWT